MQARYDQLFDNLYAFVLYDYSTRGIIANGCLPEKE